MNPRKGARKMYVRKLLASLWTCSLIVTMLGCSLPELELAPGPESAVQAWFDAVAAFDVPQMYELTHPTQRGDLEEALENPVVILGTVLGLEERQYFEMDYALVYDDGETALVHVSGKVTNRLGMIDTVDKTIELRKLDGRWFIWFRGVEF